MYGCETNITCPLSGTDVLVGIAVGGSTVVVGYPTLNVALQANMTKRLKLVNTKIDFLLINYLPLIGSVK